MRRSAVQRTAPSGETLSDREQALEDETYNIIPIQNVHADHPSLQYHEVQAAMAALRLVDKLRKPPDVQCLPSMDLLDWLAFFFGFQKENVKNQREHLVLHLANAQMRLAPLPDNIHSLDSSVVKDFRCELLKNYTTWCSFLNKKPNIWISDHQSNRDLWRELLYISLYLLIWGESANIRFMPECICYIYHNMAMELNKKLENCIDENTGQPVKPSISGENAFLNCVVKPIYETIKAEVESSKNGTAQYSAWRNYDDLNEYFWNKRCFEKLKWPIDVESNYFVNLNQQKKHVGKTGFAEQRSFWNLFRSFKRLWIMLILVLQAAIIVAWEERTFPWQALKERNVQVRVLTVFLTWSALRFLQSLLDAVMQYSLVSRESILVGVKMVLKCALDGGWMYVLGMFYWRIWTHKNNDGQWSTEANKRLIYFLEVSLVFLLPELFSLALYILPSVRNLVDTVNSKIFCLFPWWFQDRSFIGHGLREGLVDTIKYILFWVLVLASKFAFSYFLQIKPMIQPSKQLLNLKEVNYEWHELLKNSNWFSVVVLWLPVVLIYLMDLQVWYSIFSSYVGTLVGILAHLGEIRNITHLRLRFQLFGSAVQCNLIPEERLLNAKAALNSKFKVAIHQFKLRFGICRTYKKLEPNQVEANKFALIWNEVLIIFREEDIISDQELELLELPKNSWNVRVIRWPCFLLCNELINALTQTKEFVDAPDRWLWYKICKNEYRRCAVIEAYDSIKHLLLDIIKFNSEEHSIVRAIFQEIDHALQIEKFTKTFNLIALPHFHTKVIKLLELLKKPEKDINQVVNTIQALYEIAVIDFMKEKRTTAQLREDGLAPRDPAVMAGLLFQNAVELPDASNETFNRQIRRLYTIVSCRDSMHNIPKNVEARRRIAFFSNSLFMNMPRAPQVEKMMAFSVLTPYNDEEVMYSGEQISTENEDGISMLYYLQTIYDDEWRNFIERMRREGMVNDNEIWTSKLMDLRLWASYRGQTLVRTVRGMVYYYRALKMLAFLDSASEIDIQEGSQELGSMRRDGGLSRKSSCVSLMKFTYVVACQIYGDQKANKKPRAEEILYLMRSNEALRVAYVDEVNTRRDEPEYYSVLVKYDQQLEKEVEIYRIKLPGNPYKLGEGKPENQNHAIIFTRGDAMQTIDMNQDGYFEEALKMRNLLEEYKQKKGIRKPSILGVREHIFTGSVSTLAWFMSAQETSFVTLGQRIMANPLKVRMHYGHPDVFDRFWFLTRGGISKASKVLNINEDIFAGFNCTLRGGNVTHIEYIQVGKGRDLGFNQISKFEAKIAGGNGEQVLSRDVYRLGRRLDFFRMLSFFHSSVGFYFNSMMVILSVYVFLWGQFYFALSGVEASAKANNIGDKKAVDAILYQQLIIQLGIFTILPLVAESILEHGFLHSLWEFLMMQLQLSPIFYTFSLGTKVHFFGRTILHGGAKYWSTGRGFDVQHTSFAGNYRLYARSHFVKAIELGLVLIVYVLYTTTAKNTFFYMDLTISSWLLVLSWILAPFLFNPSGFDWLKTVSDFDDFMNWIQYKGGVFTEAEQSWERWWYEEQDHLRKTGFWGKLLEIVLNLRFFIFQYGIVYHLSIAGGSTSIVVYLLSWLYIVVVLVIYWAIAYTKDKYEATEPTFYRFLQFLLVIVAALVILALLQFTSFRITDMFTSLLVSVPTGWGLVLIAQVLRPYLQRTGLWGLVVSLARAYDLMFGVIVMVPVAFLSWIPGFQSMQTRILFNEAFCSGLRLFQIISGKKPKVY